jgi:haloacetate dehalogenase
MPLFEGFTTGLVDVGDAQLYVRRGGAGPPVVLLHGHPRTGATWHRVAPQLVAAGHTVVVPDLRGYGRSSKPETTADHAPYSKRAMAGDVVRLMSGLGHDRFALAGHDRGSYVALRLALDHPDIVERLALLDCIPISEHLGRCDARFAREWWHWFFFAQPEKPERAILADPDSWYGGSPLHMGEEAFAEFRSAIRNPETVRAMLEDYRAGLGIDRAHEEADRAAGRRVACPLLVMWSRHDDLEDLYGDPLEIWRSWATDLSGGPIESGHHMAEEAPDELAGAFRMFFADGGRPISAHSHHRGCSPA